MEHNKDLWDVSDGNEVTITTSEGEHFDAECTERRTETMADRTGNESMETTTWLFNAVEYQPEIRITRLLTAEDPDFPIHNEIWDQQQEGEMGFIEEIEIHN